MNFFSKYAIISIIDPKQLNMKGGEKRNMPTEKWVVYWKKNRNHSGKEIVFSRRKAVILADEKRSLGYKVTIKKAPRQSP